jgi:hypothetical protein
MLFPAAVDAQLMNGLLALLFGLAGLALTRR